MPLDQLVFLMGQLQADCAQFWPAENFHPWAAIFLADYIRGMTNSTEFLQWFTTVNSGYLPLGECIVEQIEGL